MSLGFDTPLTSFLQMPARRRPTAAENIMNGTDAAGAGGQQRPRTPAQDAATQNPNMSPYHVGGFESFHSSNVNKSGNLGGVPGKGSVYMDGPYKGMTVGQALEESKRQWASMTDDQKEGWANHATGLRAPSEGGPTAGNGAGNGSRVSFDASPLDPRAGGPQGSSGGLRMPGMMRGKVSGYSGGGYKDSWSGGLDAFYAHNPGQRRQSVGSQVNAQKPLFATDKDTGIVRSDGAAFIPNIGDKSGGAIVADGKGGKSIIGSSFGSGSVPFGQLPKPGAPAGPANPAPPPATPAPAAPPMPEPSTLPPPPVLAQDPAKKPSASG